MRSPIWEGFFDGENFLVGPRRDVDPVSPYPPTSSQPGSIYRGSTGIFQSDVSPGRGNGGHR